VVEGRVPDKVPFHHVSVSSRIASEILGREAHVGGGINQWREAVALWKGPDAHAEFIERTRADAIAIALAMGQDLVRPDYWRDSRKPAARIDDQTFRYEWDGGKQWEVRRLDPATELYNRIEGPPAPGLELENLEAQVEAAEERVRKHVPTESDFPDAAYAMGKLGQTHEIRVSCLGTAIPVDNPLWMEAVLERPDLVGRMLDVQVEESIKDGRVAAGMGLTMLFGGGDFANDSGPMYSPKIFHEFVLPRLKRISEFCRGVRAHHFFGSDGNVWPVAGDLYGSSGIAGHYEADRRAGMGIGKVHEKYPDITLIGNVTSHTLHTGTPAQVEAETRDCMEEAKRTGKGIVGCSNIIICETPMANVRAMMETMEKYR